MKTLCRNQPLLGTFVEVDISAKTTDYDLVALSNMAFEEIRRIQTLMSFHEESSELSHINRNAFGRTMPISKEMTEVLAFALDLSTLTRGSYDITVVPELMAQGGLPEIYDKDTLTGDWHDIILEDGTVTFSKDLKIDLGGIAKGFAVDRAFEIVTRHAPNVARLVINAGGDLRILDWENETVQIRSPNARTRRNDISIVMQDTALATSAPTYTPKGSLIIDRKRPAPDRSIESVSVFAPTCMIADALTKVVFLWENPLPVLQRFGASSFKLLQDGQKLDLAA